LPFHRFTGLPVYRFTRFPANLYILNKPGIKQFYISGLAQQ